MGGTESTGERRPAAGLIASVFRFLTLFKEKTVFRLRCAQKTFDYHCSSHGVKTAVQTQTMVYRTVAVRGLRGRQLVAPQIVRVLTMVVRRTVDSRRFDPSDRTTILYQFA